MDSSLPPRTGQHFEAPGLTDRFGYANICLKLQSVNKWTRHDFREGRPTRLGGLPRQRSNGPRRRSPLPGQHLVDGDDVDQAVRAVERGKQLRGRVHADAAPRPSRCRRGSTAGTCGPAAGGAPRRRRACRRARSETRKSRGRIAATSACGQPSFQVSYEAWFLASSCSSASSRPSCEVRVAQLGDLGDAVGDQDGVVGDPLRRASRRACSSSAPRPRSRRRRVQ